MRPDPNGSYSVHTKTVLIVLIATVLAGAGGWFAAKRTSAPTKPSRQERKILFYQSPMHPWIKSDQPGNCTICGMKLVPIYEGDKGFDAAGQGVTLGSNVFNVINVATEEVKKGPLVRTLQVAGSINADDRRYRVISAYVGGRIEKLLVNYVGAQVKAGDPLAVIYSQELFTAERQYATVAAEKRETPEGKRWLDSAAQRLRRLGLSDEQIAKVPAKTGDHSEIAAWMSGTVIARFVYEGQYVKEGDKLFEIADLSKMWFLFDAYERDLAWLTEGQEIEVITPEAPGKIYRSTIAFIDPHLNEMTRSKKVRVELENPLNGNRRELSHRIYAEGRVKIEQPDLTLIARRAVLNPDGKPVAYVDMGGGRYERRELKLGKEGDESWEVLEGVKEGEKVVSNGALLIDAQAQLEGLTKPAPMEPSQSPEALNNYFTMVDAAGAALASDDLARYNEAAPKLHAAMPSLMEIAAAQEQWQPILKRISDCGHLKAAPDLKSARKAFLPLSLAAVDLAKASRASVKIYSCPMVSQAVPHAVNPGLWIQVKPPLRNPFFGAEMLECGTEVKP